MVLNQCKMEEWKKRIDQTESRNSSTYECLPMGILAFVLLRHKPM